MTNVFLDDQKIVDFSETIFGYVVPIWEKIALTIPEAAKLSNVGEKRLREIASNPKLNLKIQVGNKMLIKRKALEQFLITQIKL